MARASCGCEEGTAGPIHTAECLTRASSGPVVGVVSPAPGGGPAVKTIEHGGSFRLKTPPAIPPLDYNDPLTMGTLHNLVIAEIRFGHLGQGNYRPVSTEGAARAVLDRFDPVPYTEELIAKLVARVDRELRR